MIFDAIKSLCPDARFGVVNNSYDQIEWWSDDIPIPTEEEVNAEVVRLKELEEAKVQAAIDAKQSALNKLMALGLTEEEALALGVK